MNKVQQHERVRIKSMTDEQLNVRYGKMNKPEKIEAFLEGLVSEGRNETLQQAIAKEHGLELKKGTSMNFVRVIKNEDNHKSAIFLQPESGQHYLYSYVNNDMANETMVFKCDDDGNCPDMHEVAVAHGYEHSAQMMDRLTEVLSHEC